MKYVEPERNHDQNNNTGDHRVIWLYHWFIKHNNMRLLSSVAWTNKKTWEYSFNRVKYVIIQGFQQILLEDLRFLPCSYKTWQSNSNKKTLLWTWTRDHTSYELVSFFMVARDVNFPRPDINFPFSETRAVCSRHSLRWDQSQSSADTEHSQQWWSSPAWHWSSPPPPSPVSPPPGQGWPAWVWWCCQPVTPSDAGLTTKEYHSRMNLMSYQSSR